MARLTLGGREERDYGKELREINAPGGLLEHAYSVVSGIYNLERISSDKREGLAHLSGIDRLILKSDNPDEAKLIARLTAYWHTHPQSKTVLDQGAISKIMGERGNWFRAANGLRNLSGITEIAYDNIINYSKGRELKTPSGIIFVDSHDEYVRSLEITPQQIPEPREIRPYEF